MKDPRRWKCFAGGFAVSFLPFLTPNGWLLVAAPFLGLYRLLAPYAVALIAYYGLFVFMLIAAFREKEWAYAWVLGSILSVIVGFALVFTVGFNFVHV